MAQEQNSQKCSNSSSGGVVCRSSKKLKQKKVPQRGLGVAQLEKIRLEEQQRKDSAILSPNSIISPNSPLNLAFQSPNSSIPFPSSPKLSDLSSSIPSTSPNLGRGQINWPKLLNGEYNLEGENQLFDLHNGFVYGSNMNFPCESWSPPILMNRSHQFQQPPSSSSMVMNCIEPPSNQSYCSNNYIPMWPEEEKVVGMKRSYPFSLDNPPWTPSFHCKFPPTYFPPVTRSDESASSGNGGKVNIKSSHLVSREVPSSSSTISEPNSKKVMTESGGCNGDFLTLAPPTTTLPHSSSKFNYPSAYILPEFECLPYQGSVEEPIHRHGPSGSIQQHLLHSFFPSEKQQIGQASTSISNFDGEVCESVDLNLKL